MTVRLQVIKVYDVSVEAKNADEAIRMAYDMQTTEIEQSGKFIDATTDHAEIRN